MIYFLKISSLTPKRGEFQFITEFVVFLSDIQTKVDLFTELSGILNVLLVCYLPKTILTFFCFYIWAKKKLAFFMRIKFLYNAFPSRISTHHFTLDPQHCVLAQLFLL